MTNQEIKESMAFANAVLNALPDGDAISFCSGYLAAKISDGYDDEEQENLVCSLFVDELYKLICKYAHKEFNHGNDTLQDAETNTH